MCIRDSDLSELRTSAGDTKGRGPDIQRASPIYRQSCRPSRTIWPNESKRIKLQPFGDSNRDLTKRSFRYTSVYTWSWFLHRSNSSRIHSVAGLHRVASHAVLIQSSCTSVLSIMVCWHLFALTDGYHPFPTPDVKVEKYHRRED